MTFQRRGNRVVAILNESNHARRMETALVEVPFLSWLEIIQMRLSMSSVYSYLIDKVQIGHGLRLPQTSHIHQIVL